MLTLFTLVALAVLAVVVAHALAFLIAMYEAANAPAAPRIRLSGSALTAEMPRILLELAAVATCTLALPFGLLPWRHPSRRPASNRPPVVCIHGWGANRGVFLVLRHRLLRDGWRTVIGVNYRSIGGDVARAAERLCATIETVRHTTGSTQVVLLAHGLGGLVCRHYLAHGDGLTCVARLVTLGTAHRGTKLAALALDSMAQATHPDASLIQDLATDDPLPGRLDATAIYPSFDHVVVPSSHAYWSGVGNIEVEGVGHTGLLWSRRVYELVRESLEWSGPASAEPVEARRGR